MWFRAHVHKNCTNSDVGMEKEKKQELGWRVSVLPIHHCEPLCVACTQCTVNAGMGNTDTLHPNSCFCSFSIPTSEIF